MTVRGSTVSLFLLCILMPAFSPARAEQVQKFDGRPVFSEGSERSYFVWRDGDTWHVRWTTMGKMLRFTGHVVAEGGELKSLKRIDVEEERRVVRRARPGTVTVGPRGRVRVRPGQGPVVATTEQDKIEREGDRRIVWLARTDADIDGFDFKVDDQVRALLFTLEIEGASNARDVEIGRDNQRPPANPFRVDLR